MMNDRSKHVEAFSRAGWGVFLHFLAIPPSCSLSPRDLTPDAWNARVDAFRADLLAEQLCGAGVRYLFLTVGQNSGYYCAPNATLDRLTGRTGRTSRCSSRDLVADLARELSARGVTLYAYLPSHAPMGDFKAVDALGFLPEWDFAQWGPLDQQEFRRAGRIDPDPRLTVAQRNWEAILREWSLRWGTRVGGWWFDGCYYYERMYRSVDAPNFHSFAAAGRAGNPGAIIAFNSGVRYPPEVLSEEEDYSAGECVDPERMLAAGLGGTFPIQRHVLSYLGTFWAAPPLRFSADAARRYTEEFNRQGVVVSWDIPFRPHDGTLSDDTRKLLAALPHPVRPA